MVLGPGLDSNLRWVFLNSKILKIRRGFFVFFLFGTFFVIVSFLPSSKFLMFNWMAKSKAKRFREATVASIETPEAAGMPGMRTDSACV